MKRSLAAVFVLLFGVPDASFANPGFESACLVRDVTTSSPDGKQDREFLDQNRKKRFAISVTQQSIIVKMESDHFKDSTTEFKVIESQNAFSDIYGLAKTHITSLESISINNSEDDGRRTATLVVQSALYVNVWHLACVDAR